MVSGANARARPDRDMTTGEAEAWLAGFEAAREAALVALGYGGSEDARWNLAGLADDLRGKDPVGFRTADRVEKQIHAAIRAMEPPKQETKG